MFIELRVRLRYLGNVRGAWAWMKAEKKKTNKKLNNNKKEAKKA